MNIAIALNRKVVPQTCVFLRSLYVNHPDREVSVFVMQSDLTTEDQSAMESVFPASESKRLVFYHVDADSLPEDLPTNIYWSIEMYYRLMLPDVLPEDVDRILYLDIDMIVNKDISDFYDMDLGNHLLAVSRDQEFLNLLEEEREVYPVRYQHFTELMERGMTYFCSGMILFNIDAMRGRYTFRYYMDRFKEIADWVVLPDQDLLNYVHWQDAVFVDETKYGLFSQTAHGFGVTYEEVKVATSIIHFTGRAKPWTVNLIRYDIEKIWWEYAKGTPYYYAMLEQVYFQSMESHLVEDTVNRLSAENGELKDLVKKMQGLMEKL
ncbi:MAG: hypothetical protein K6B14_11360 [Lachnospiraceae bacterium]|nr:hypothetical protein [Lachnospiraceae bacterium]